VKTKKLSIKRYTYVVPFDLKKKIQRYDLHPLFLYKTYPPRYLFIYFFSCNHPQLNMELVKLRNEKRSVEDRTVKLHTDPFIFFGYIRASIVIDFFFNIQITVL